MVRPETVVIENRYNDTDNTRHVVLEDIKSVPVNKYDGMETRTETSKKSNPQ